MNSEEQIIEGFIKELVNVLTQIDSLNEQVGIIKDEIKEKGLDASSLVTVAKAIVKNKVDDLREKSEKVLKAIEARP